MGRVEKKQSQLSDLYGALNIGQSIVFVNSRPPSSHLIHDIMLHDALFFISITL